MQRPNKTMLRIGAWRVNPTAVEISREGKTARLELRTMRLLLCLAEHAGEVVSIDDLLSQVWPDVIVSPDSVYQAVTTLRRLLGDDPKHPSYIATVPRMGYRMIAKVSHSPEPAVAESGSSHESPGARRRIGYPAAIVGVLCVAIVLVLGYRWRDKTPGGTAGTALAAQPQRSVAVLPLLDLTEGMKEEEFADGMTEELIDKLSKVSGLRVPGATSSFYYKGKQMPVADIAKALGVAYVLDGSVRKSGARLRIAARLVRADTGFVAWSETYDRPFVDRLMVQDDIASEVTRALTASIDSAPR